MSNLLFIEFQDYAKTLAELHVDIAHNNATRTGFIKMNSDDEINSLPVDASPNIVILSDFVGRATGAPDDQRLRQNASLSFFCYAETGTGNPTAEIQAAQQKAMQIMFDFYSRMRFDQEEDDCGALRFAKLEMMTFRPDGPILERHYGWEMTIPFDAFAPSYNPTKWTDTP